MGKQSSDKIEYVQQYILVLRCQAGDDNAFEQLYDLYNNKTMRFLKSWLNEEAARDINQEVWLSVYLNIAELMHPESFRTWLYRITRFAAIDCLRTKQRQIEFIETFVNEMSNKFHGKISHEEIEEIVSFDLSEIIEMLSPHHREVIILKYWEGMSYEEIALIVGSPIGTIRSRIHHAKQKIKEFIDKSE